MTPDRTRTQASLAEGKPGGFGSRVLRGVRVVVGGIGLWFAGLGIAVIYSGSSPAARRRIKLGFVVLGVAFAAYLVADGQPEFAPFAIALLLAQLTGFQLLDQRRDRRLAQEHERRRQRAREGWA